MKSARKTIEVSLKVASCFALALTSCAPGTDDDGSLGTTDERVVACSRGPTVRGIDVAHYQGSINWHAVRDGGYQWAVASVGDGYFEDPMFDSNWRNMRAAGMIRGAYQFFRPNDDPIRQADILIRKVGRLGPGDLPATIDVEVTGGMSPSAIAERVATWMAHVEAGTGRRPMIYTGAWFWDPDVSTSRFSHDSLWVSGYVSCPNTPEGWSRWTIWQYTDNAHVPGISAGGVDGDLFEGTLDQLRAFANGGDPGPTTEHVPPAPMHSCGEIDANEGLGSGRSIRSCDGHHELVMQTDGNLVLYHDGRATWASGTYHAGGYALWMQADGNAVVYDRAAAPLWAAGTFGHGGAHLAVQDDGNLVVYAGTRPLWASNTDGR